MNPANASLHLWLSISISPRGNIMKIQLKQASVSYLKHTTESKKHKSAGSYKPASAVKRREDQQTYEMY